MGNETIIPIILSGGQGTRLWPSSRKKPYQSNISLLIAKIILPFYKIRN